jgi:hypothetical protein
MPWRQVVAGVASQGSKSSRNSPARRGVTYSALDVATRSAGCWSGRFPVRSVHDAPSSALAMTPDSEAAKMRPSNGWNATACARRGWMRVHATPPFVER